MKLKVFITIGILVVAISLFTGYIVTEANKSVPLNSKKKVVVVNTDENNAKILSKSSRTNIIKDVIGYTDLCKPIYDVSSYQVTKGKSEYSTLKGFVEDTYKNWQPKSKYRSIYAKQTDADWQIANATLYYVNYFKEEIDKNDLTQIFSELQQIAYQIVSGNGSTESESNSTELRKQFSKKVREVYLNV